MIMKESKIRNEIYRKVSEFYSINFAESKFIPGVNPVRYAGRVFDENELINLVDASLDFWLTAGEYAKTLEKKLAYYM